MAEVDRQRLAELFGQAIELPFAQRAEWVSQACGDDSALRGLLECLLSADAAAGDFLEPLPATVAAAAIDQLRDGPAPSVFGPWRVLRALGSGGMGDVWLAERGDGEFEQRVAIKRLAWPTPGLLQRFRQERRILARLKHPGIAALIDGGVDASGVPYFVMEYVDGEPLLAHARTRSLDLRARLRLFARVCEAVRYAHQNLVVHRDLKPSNILVQADGTPKLLDFGIAKVLATTDQGERTATQLLTPAYAAPEQFSGAPVTTATDVYALGVVLYELISGKRPQWAAANPGGDATGDRSPLPPSSANPGEPIASRLLRGDLDRIALTALARDPQQRYSSAEALGADIERYLAGRPISVRRASLRYRFAKFTARHRYAIAASAALVAIAMTAAGLYLHQIRLTLAQGERTEAVRQFLVGIFREANPDENRGQPFTAQQLLERSENALANVTKADVAAELNAIIAGLYWDLGDTAGAGKLQPRLQAAAEDGSLPIEIRVRSLNQLARFEVDQRMLDAATTHARAAIALLGGAEQSADASTARHLLANALAGAGNPDAERFLRELLADDRERSGARSEDAADDLLLLAMALDMRARPDAAAEAAREQLDISRSLHGPVHSTVSNGLNMLAIALQHQGDYDGAESTFREAVDAETQRLGPEQPQTLVIRSNLLDVLDLRGDFARSLPQRLELVALERRVLAGTLDEQIAMDVQSLGAEYLELGDFAQAETMLRDALATWSRIQGSNDRINSARPLELLGLALMWQSRGADAETTLRRALAVLRSTESPSLARVQGELGDLLRREHRYADARRELDAAIAAQSPRESTRPDATSATVKSQLALVMLDANDGDGTAAAGEALAMARTALPAKSCKLATPLYAQARARMAEDRAAEAEALLREVQALQCPQRPAHDPRILETEVALTAALAAQGKREAARSIALELAATFNASPIPVSGELRDQVARLAEKAQE